jgi:hypothetical protein
MATHTNLASLFTAIADAIRAKTGGTETIVADNFPTAIAGIETGGGGGIETATITFGYDYDVVVYTNGNGEVVWKSVASDDKIVVAKNTVIYVSPYTGDITCVTGGVIDITYEAIWHISNGEGVFYATADGTIYDD